MNRNTTKQQLLSIVVLVTTVVSLCSSAFAGRKGLPEIPQTGHTNQDGLPGPPDPPPPPPPPPGGLFNGPKITPPILDKFGTTPMAPFGGTIGKTKLFIPPVPRDPTPPLNGLFGDLDDLGGGPNLLFDWPLIPRTFLPPFGGTFPVYVVPEPREAPINVGALEDSFSQPLPAPGALSLIALGTLSLLSRRRRRADQTG